MWPILTIDFIICGAALGLAAAAIARPAHRRLKLSAVLSLVAITAVYVVFQPNARAALIYYRQKGGSFSDEWHAGVTSLQAVTWPFTLYTLVAAVLLAIIALRSK